jgi:hypothetical protein
MQEKCLRKSGLKSFRKRHKIVFNEVCGAGVDVCEETSRLDCHTLFSYGCIGPRGPCTW